MRPYVTIMILYIVQDLRIMFIIKFFNCICQNFCHIKELKDENGRLYKLLREKDQEIRQMKKKQEAEKMLAAAGASTITNDTAATKIVELSKKLRELASELESERTKSKQLARKCEELAKEVAVVDLAYELGF